MPVYKYENKKGVKWYYSFKFQDTRYLKRGFDTKKAATLAESEKRIELEKFGRLEKRIKLVDFCKLYLLDIKNRESQPTLEKATLIIEKYILPNIQNKYLDQYTTRDISDWQRGILKLNLSDTYTHVIDARMRAIFNHAIKFSTLHKSPCVGLKTIGKQNRELKEHAIWTFEDWRKITDFGSIEVETFLSIMFFTGMRFGEIMALTWNDVDIQNKIIVMNKQRRKSGEIVNTKTGSQIDYNINEKLVILIKRYKESNVEKQKQTDFVFNKSRTFYSRSKDKLEKIYNLPHIRIHDLRHSHATLLINNDINIHVIADRLGHSSTRTTERVYAHLYDEKKKEVVDLLDSLDW